MNATSSLQEQLRHSLTTPTRGVLGLVEDLLLLSCEHGIRLEWNTDSCRTRFLDSPPGWIEVPLRKSVFRAALARVAVLCNQRKPNSVSPYGGQGELTVGTDNMVALRVAFVNTPDEQTLNLEPLRTEHRNSMPETQSKGLNQEAAQVPENS